MNTMKQTLGILVFIITSLAMSGCGPAPPPKGVVKGVLIGRLNPPYTNNEPAKGIQVILGTLTPKRTCTVSNESLAKSTNADNTGAFSFSNMTAGKYCLVVVDGRSGVMGAVLTSEKQTFTFEVHEVAGIDLGKVVIYDIQLP